MSTATGAPATARAYRPGPTGPLPFASLGAGLPHRLRRPVPSHHELVVRDVRHRFDVFILPAEEAGGFHHLGEPREGPFIHLSSVLPETLHEVMYFPGGGAICEEADLVDRTGPKAHPPLEGDRLDCHVAHLSLVRSAPSAPPFRCGGPQPYLRCPRIGRYFHDPLTEPVVPGPAEHSHDPAKHPPRARGHHRELDGSVEVCDYQVRADKERGRWWIRRGCSSGGEEEAGKPAQLKGSSKEGSL
jgi:hypothetical protein